MSLKDILFFYKDNCFVPEIHVLTMVNATKPELEPAIAQIVLREKNAKQVGIKSDWYIAKSADNS